MNFRDLQYFVAIAENKHFGKAADQCFVSQPTLSMQLKKLEQELDIQLFERDKKQVRLTHAGQKIVGQAEVILREMQTLKSLARLSSDPLSGDFKIGVIPTLAPYLLPYIVPDMKKQFSRVKFYLFEQQTHELLSLLQKGQLDLALLALPASGAFESRELFKELFYLMMPQNHSLSKEKKVSLEQINRQELLLLGEGHCLRDQALAACNYITDSVNEGLNFSATSLETLRHMVTLGNGVTLMPELSLTLQNGAQDVVMRPFKDPQPFRTIGMIWRSSSSHTELIGRLGDFIIERMKNKLKIKS